MSLPTATALAGANSGRRHTVVVSDIHLSQAHPEDPSDPLWMRYRLREHHPDNDFAELLDHLLTRFEGDFIELVFNGDVFDFDAPWVKDGQSSDDEFPLDDAGCAEQMRRILADHEPFFRAVARVLLRGHRALFMSGNHDIELYWPGVRQVVRAELGRLVALEAEAMTAPLPVDLEQQVRFRAWFHVTEDRIYIEHGSQYDFLNNVRHAMIPLTRDERAIHPVMGKLAFKRTGARMGYFNPYFEDTFYMGVFDHLWHFLSAYAFSSRRHIARVWAKGALSTVFEILRERHNEPRYERARQAAHEETGASFEAIDKTHALALAPSEDTMLPIIRGLWVDRVALACLFMMTTLLFALFGGALTGLYTLGVCGLLFAVYEALTPKPELRDYDAAPPSVEKIFEIHDVRAICLGHTHRPSGKFREDGRFIGNSGAWCPAFEDKECTKPVLSGRPLLLLTSEGEAFGGGLHFFRDGKLVLDESSGRAVPEVPRVEGRAAAELPVRA